MTALRELAYGNRKPESSRTPLAGMSRVNAKGIAREARTRGGNRHHMGSAGVPPASLTRYWRAGTPASLTRYWRAGTPASLTRYWRAGTPALPTGFDAYPRERGEHWKGAA